jgi:hypothetical protein
MFFHRRHSATVLLFGFLAVVSVSSLAHAQEPLRWKFKKGEKLAYDSNQDMTITVTGAQGGNFEMRTDQKLNLLWDVVDVTPEGDARIRQKLARVQLEMTGPAPGSQAEQGERKTETVKYDSQAKEPPVGGAAMAAAMFQPMMDGEFEFTLTSRGEVKDVKVPAPVLEMIKKNPEAAQMGDLATDAGIQKLLMQEIVVLPQEAPKANETKWSSTMEMPIPVVGRQTIETSYTFKELRDAAGKKEAVIDTARTVKYEKPADQQIQVTIKEQSSDGETVFNVTDGRLSTATLNQNIVIEAAGVGQVIQQKLAQKSKIAVRLADETPKSEGN